MSDKIRVWVKDMDSGEVLEELGTVLTDNPRRAVEAYNEDAAWLEKGHNADIVWEWVDDIKRAAAAMGAITSEKKASTSRENGKKGGRPRKAKETKGA